MSIGMSQSMPRAPRAQLWTPPVVLPGDTVLVYRHRGDTQPIPAVVNRVGGRTIWASGFVNGVTELETWRRLDSGIRHASDPDLGYGSEEGTTCWDYTPQTRSYVQMAQVLAQLSDAVRALIVCNNDLQKRIAKLEELLADDPLAEDPLAEESAENDPETEA